MHNDSRGYILISLMLFLALLAIAALAVLPEVAFQVKRDREEEMIHRGVGYSRAVRRYFKKYGRYPMRLEDLENTNNLRFLRKRYKDPITNDEFVVLHFGDPKLVGLLRGPAIGATGPAPGGQPTPPASNPNPTQPPPSSGDSSGGQPNPSAPPSSGSGSSATPQTFGGGPIVGVMSASTAQSIREFNKKNHYKDWFFIYDPTGDRGGLINGPYQPSLSPIIPQIPGRPGSPGLPGSPTQINPPQNPPNPMQPPMQ